MNRSPEHGPRPQYEAAQEHELPPELPGAELLPEHLISGEVSVVRTSGHKEAGWMVEGAHELIDEKTGESIVVVGVSAEAPEDSGHEVLYKQVRLSDLEEWNKPTEQQADNLNEEPVASPEELRAIAKEANRQREVGSAALAGSGAEGSRHLPELIKGVPTAAELQARQEAESIEAEDKLREQLDSMVEGLNESDRLNVWRYSAGLVNKREAQFRDDGEGSIMHEQNAGQARRALSPDGLEVVDKYYSTYVRLQNLRAARNRNKGR